MGMAASQARYLALVARKSNCEYEGQQINQARTALSNQSANLFNQMLGLEVPVPPSTQDFTKVQYSFTDGLNGSTIDSWQQLGGHNEDYNYVVTHHYFTDVYTGSEKKLTDPQVQGLKPDTTEEMLNTAKTALDNAQANYDANPNPDTLAALNQAKNNYADLFDLTYIGNCELTKLDTLTEDQEAEIAQIVKDMEAQGITSNITGCYDPETGAYTPGSIYTFTMNGVTYYTTEADLQNSIVSGTGPNNIDGQQKLPYYNASYVSTKIEKTEKALLETDSEGRFASIRFEDDSITYALEMETITDDVAYQDAMNQYYYESAKYDKIIQDINAKTSIIHQQDQQLELKMKQLETEHNALANEIDAVQKVVKDNVDKSFKTFGG